ncbi:MAG: hypothetical protein IJ014_04870, partial [Rikenellaceae bacterium]|nr:hypothetical protein [Rikenellaceae bacterium]
PTGTGKQHMTYGCHPNAYKGSHDVSMSVARTRKVGDTRLELVPIYCLPTLYYGHLSGGGYDGAFPLTIILP